MSQAKQRFDFVDQFRGLIGILMLLGHCSYYFNSIWKQLDPFDPLFPTWGQFALRYAGYLCAPGFLTMAGAMVWLSFNRSTASGSSAWKAQWHLIQRGIFLVIVQMLFVNASWGGFASLNLWHLGIISTIGMSMICIALIIRTPWYIRLILAMLLLLIHPFLLTLTYNHDSASMNVLMETFVQSGDFNKYPLLPWLALALLGSVMANFWFRVWKTNKKRVFMGVSIALLSVLASFIIRMGRGFGNIFEFDSFASISFFADQKYPPSLFHQLFFFGMVVLGVTVFVVLNRYIPKVTRVFSITGKVPLFFYCIHLAILGVFVKRLDFFYLRGDIALTFIGFAIMLCIMLPLSAWFYRVKLRSNNYFIKMI